MLVRRSLSDIVGGSFLEQLAKLADQFLEILTESGRVVLAGCGCRFHLVRVANAVLGHDVERNPVKPGPAREQLKERPLALGSAAVVDELLLCAPIPEEELLQAV